MGNSDKKMLPTFLLSFFLGTLGVHRFYVGRVASGMVMLLLTLSLVGLLVSALWNFVDWVTILCGAFRDADGRLIK
jgi:TM2 domain-containing membrane protein YozV